MTGTVTGDNILGIAGANVLNGEGGADSLHGRQADDTLRGGDDDDALWGNVGSDKLYGDACLWENDPNSPNYRACLDVGKIGGANVVSVYTIRIIGGGGTSQRQHMQRRLA